MPNQNLLVPDCSRRGQDLESKALEKKVNDETLKSCPFCGARLTKETNESDTYFYVRCWQCRVSTDWYDSPEKALAVWNRRAEDDIWAGFDDYQRSLKQFVKYRDDVAIQYLSLGLCSEAGEVADKLKKNLRDGDGTMTAELRQAIVKELGDVLFYVAMLAAELGEGLSDVADGNLAKLQSRLARGVIGGSGDER